MKGIAKIELGKSEYASVKYKGYLTAAIERWKEYRNQLKPLNKKPVLFIMMNSTEEADDVAEWIAKAYPAEFGDGKTQTIHTKKSGEISDKDLDKARETVKNVDRADNPINAIECPHVARRLGRAERDRRGWLASLHREGQHPA